MVAHSNVNAVDETKESVCLEDQLSRLRASMQSMRKEEEELSRLITEQKHTLPPLRKNASVPMCKNEKIHALYASIQAYTRKHSEQIIVLTTLNVVLIVLWLAHDHFVESHATLTPRVRSAFNAWKMAEQNLSSTQQQYKALLEDYNHAESLINVCRVSMAALLLVWVAAWGTKDTS